MTEETIQTLSEAMAQLSLQPGQEPAADSKKPVCEALLCYNKKSQWKMGKNLLDGAEVEQVEMIWLNTGSKLSLTESVLTGDRVLEFLQKEVKAKQLPWPERIELDCQVGLMKTLHRTEEGEFATVQEMLKQQTAEIVTILSLPPEIFDRRASLAALNQEVRLELDFYEGYWFVVIFYIGTENVEQEPLSRVGNMPWNQPTIQELGDKVLKIRERQPFWIVRECRSELGARLTWRERYGFAGDNYLKLKPPHLDYLISLFYRKGLDFKDGYGLVQKSKSKTRLFSQIVLERGALRRVPSLGNEQETEDGVLILSTKEMTSIQLRCLKTGLVVDGIAEQEEEADETATLLTNLWTLHKKWPNSLLSTATDLLEAPLVEADSFAVYPDDGEIPQMKKLWEWIRDVGIRSYSPTIATTLLKEEENGEQRESTLLLPSLP